MNVEAGKRMDLLIIWSKDLLVADIYTIKQSKN
jgi:hypothetical protein